MKESEEGEGDLGISKDVEGSKKTLTAWEVSHSTKDHSLDKHTEKQLPTHSFGAFLYKPREPAPKWGMHEPEIFHYAFGAVILTFPFSFKC